MKDFFKGISLITAALLLFPALPMLIGALNPPEEPSAPVTAELSVPKAPAAYELLPEIRLYDTVSAREIVLTTEEYLVSALAAQLSPTAEKELLKAQTVVMYTYILKRRNEEIAAPTAALNGCDISTDTSKYPRLALGQDEPLDREPYRKAIAEVMGEYVAYQNEPISVAYCYSAGKVTESAETVLGVDVPYLKSVQSGEPDAFYTTVSYTADEVFARLTTADSGYVLLGGAEKWITPKETTDSGYVQSVYLDSRFVVSGSEIARLLNLPSAKFTYRYSPSTDRFTFTVSGSGSLAGLSLRGAAAMAAGGSSYREILEHYFSGVEIISSKNVTQPS